MPSLMGDPRETHLAVVAVLISLIELVRNLGQRIEGDWTLGNVELGRIDSSVLQHADIVVERAGVCFEGESVGHALEICLGPGEGNVDLAEILAPHEL